MSNISAVARRAVVLVALAAAVAALVAWWRDASRHDRPASPPQWPPLDPVVPAAAPATTSAEPSTLRWRLALPDEPEAPDGFPVKVKVSSGIYHSPGGRFYDRTRPDRWYESAEAAEADGYRRSKS